MPPPYPPPPPPPRRQPPRPNQFWVAAPYAACGLLSLATVAILVLVNDYPGVATSLLSTQRHPVVAEKVSAQEVFSLYRRSPSAADQRFRSKALELTGHVAREYSDQRGRSIVLFVTNPLPGFEGVGDAWRRIAAASASGIEGVRCLMADAKGSAVEDGQEIRIRGRCVGMPLDVELVDCEVVFLGPKPKPLPPPARSQDSPILWRDEDLPPFNQRKQPQAKIAEEEPTAPPLPPVTKPTPPPPPPLASQPPPLKSQVPVLLHMPREERLPLVELTPHELWRQGDKLKGRDVRTEGVAKAFVSIATTLVFRSEDGRRHLATVRLAKHDESLKHQQSYRVRVWGVVEHTKGSITHVKDGVVEQLLD